MHGMYRVLALVKSAWLFLIILNDIIRMVDWQLPVVVTGLFILAIGGALLYYFTSDEYVIIHTIIMLIASLV